MVKQIGKAIEIYNKKYENISFMDGFNVDHGESNMKAFPNPFK